MEKKNIINVLIIVVFVAGAAFYGGMQYGSRKSATSQFAQGGRSGGNFNGGANGGQRGVQQGGQGGGMRGPANAGSGDFASGQIISKDDTSITIKTRDGGSKIIFFSVSTGVDKSVAGSSSDLAIGQQVTVNGKAGSDGSLSAQNIQIHPTQPSQSETQNK